MSIKALLARIFADTADRPAPPGHAVYAIGVIHGRADLLDALLSQIKADAEDDSEIIFLGDYGNRGPNSAVVLDMVIAAKQAWPRVTTLKGNHEAVMLDFLNDASVGPAWARYGGLDTLMAYGIEPPRTADPDAWEQARETFAQVLPAMHRRLLTSLDISCERGCYFFAHAGVDPQTPLDQQREEALLWIRDPFLNNERKLERIIVHGHSPTPEAHHDDRRIGVDTGAYATGVLTAARLKDGEVSYIQTRGI